MGKADAPGRKSDGNIPENAGNCNSGNFVNSSNGLSSLRGCKEAGCNLFHFPTGHIGGESEYLGSFSAKGVNKNGFNADVPVKDKTDNSYEVWCICRIVKPCRRCQGNKDKERDVTPTPENTEVTCRDRDSASSTPTPEPSEENEENVNKELTEVDTKVLKPSLNYSCESVKINSSNTEIPDNIQNFSPESTVQNTNINTVCECNPAATPILRSRYNSEGSDKDLNELISVEKAVSGLQELLERLEDISDKENPAVGKIAEPWSEDKADTSADTDSTIPDTPTSKMDNASTCSFDHLDFDTSFCSMKSTDLMMDQGDLADQLSMVQQMVVEMKTGFSRAMDELSNIQYGDETLTQQLADNKAHCGEEINGVKKVVDELKVEVQNLCGRIQQVSDVQKNLQEKLDSYQSDKDVLLDELERSGAITDQIRLRLSGGAVRENNNNNNSSIPADVAPMVHPYLNSLQNYNQRAPEDNYNSDSSLTAAVSRSLNLTQALGEKCLHLDLSTASSDDEDNSRHSHSESSQKRVKRHGSFQYEEGNRSSQKVPPHEHVLEEVHREEATRDIVDAEKEYCSQIWSLLEDYVNPLRDEEIISKRELHFLFPAYIPHIYEQHCIILRKLEERMKKWKFNGVVGDVFAKFTDSQDGDGLALYKDFISDFPTVINVMNKWFTHSPHFRELMQSQCLANSPVLPLLLAPLQQIPKYSLLLKNLLKYTPPDHPDRYYLESSLSRLKHFLNNMNNDLEHAMKVINTNSQPMNRSRESGHSARSRSSGSSGEVNHMSRDSGVHSNEEERAKSPMSPNTTRRFLLQVLREKREQGPNHGHTRPDGRVSTPRGRQQPGYGSHPDLSNQYHLAQDGRMSPYLASLPQSKMFSSLSKLPLPRENSRKSRSNRDGSKPQINTNYLRPLTPQVFPTSTSAHSFESARRREEYAEKMRHRPASAIEFSYDSHDRHDQYFEMMAHQAALAVSPPHSSSSDRSRRELQLSLQKLLIETNNTAPADFSDNEQDESEAHMSTYHKQFLATKDRILRHGSDTRQGSDKRRNSNNRQNQGNFYESHSGNEEQRQHFENAQDDYGIYGDDDDDDEDDEGYEQEEVKPMKLIPDNHKPKIMVPRWRQNASPQPPSYSHSVEHLSKTQTDFTSEENLAASLAQSLLENKTKRPKSPSKDKPFKENTNHKMGNNEEAYNTGSLKRREKTKRAESPQSIGTAKSPARQSQGRILPNGVAHGRSFSVDTSPSRPTDLKLNPVTTNSSQNTNSVNTDVESPITVTKLPSVTKLNDVIAYTADCLEKKEGTTLSSGNESDTFPQTMASKSSSMVSKSSSASTNIPIKSADSSTGKFSLSDVLSDQNLKVSSVDTNNVMSGVEKTTPVANPVSGNIKFTFATSPITVSSKENVSPLNTESIVHYFQNRNQLNQGNIPSTVETTASSNGRVPTFISMDKTSTPVSEHQTFIPNKSHVRETLPNFAKKESGRMVRADEVINDQNNAITHTNGATNKNDKGNENGGDEGSNKETVLRAVDKLRMSFEKQKQISEERRQSQTQTQQIKIDRNGANISKTGIQKRFNELSSPTKALESNSKPVILKTFSSPQRQTSENSEDSVDLNNDHAEQKQGHYKKVGQLRTPTKYPTDASASARQIMKLERSVSPTNGRPTIPTSQYETFKSQVESSTPVRPTRRGVSPQRAAKEGSFIPQRSKSPTRASMERERPKSTTELTKMSLDSRLSMDENGDNSTFPLKSAMKETKIPVLKKTGVTQLSKSSEDISKMKKKSAFKDQLRNIFGRKKKKSKLYNNGYDPDEEYRNHVTIVTEQSFQHMDDVMNFPLSRERRSNSTSQILRSYTFESEDDDDYNNDDDGDPISAV